MLIPTLSVLASVHYPVSQPLRIPSLQLLVLQHLRLPSLQCLCISTLYVPWPLIFRVGSGRFGPWSDYCVPQGKTCLFDHSGLPLYASVTWDNPALALPPAQLPPQTDLQPICRLRRRVRRRHHCRRRSSRRRLLPLRQLRDGAGRQLRR
jgi:hypothetical protein